jgi:hypothetical protein
MATVKSDDFKVQGETCHLEICPIANGYKIEASLSGNLCFTATVSIADAMFFTADNSTMEEFYSVLATFVKSQMQNKRWKKPTAP